MGLFRQDLYYRINVFPIHLPPLRERRDDILLLADHFVAKYAAKMGKEVRRISTPAINMMLAYHWPGNVRELENCIEYAVLLSSDGVIHGHNLPPTLQMPDLVDTAAAGSLKIRVELLEQDMIVDAPEDYRRQRERWPPNSWASLPAWSATRSRSCGSIISSSSRRTAQDRRENNVSPFAERKKQTNPGYAH